MMRPTLAFALWVAAFLAHADEVPHVSTATTMEQAGMVDIRSLVPDLSQEIAYSGSDNFVGAPVDGYEAPRCWLKRDAAEALKGAWIALFPIPGIAASGALFAPAAPEPIIPDATMLGGMQAPAHIILGWADANLKAHAEARVTDRELAAAGKRFPINPPLTKEAYYYRSLFGEFYPGPAAAETVPGGKSIACSSPAAIAWDASFASAADPSGRAIAGVHNAAH